MAIIPELVLKLGNCGCVLHDHICRTNTMFPETIIFYFNKNKPGTNTVKNKPKAENGPSQYDGAAYID